MARAGDSVSTVHVTLHEALNRHAHDVREVIYLLCLYGWNLNFLQSVCQVLSPVAKKKKRKKKKKRNIEPLVV